MVDRNKFRQSWQHTCGQDTKDTMSTDTYWYAKDDTIYTISLSLCFPFSLPLPPLYIPVQLTSLTLFSFTFTSTYSLSSLAALQYIAASFFLYKCAFFFFGISVTCLFFLHCFFFFILLYVYTTAWKPIES